MPDSRLPVPVRWKAFDDCRNNDLEKRRERAG
jgi:hypothetical protein